MTDLAKRFRRLSRTIHDLQQTQGLLDWDQQTMMPRGGTTQRAHQLAALATVIHEKVTAPELDEVMTGLEGGGLDPLLQADLRELRRERDRAVRIPEELVAERARVCAEAQTAWEEAYERNSFSLFQPHLEQVLDVVRRVAAALSGARSEVSAYDLMLEEYEPGATEAQLRELFDGLGPTLSKLLERILDAPLERRPDRDLLRGSFPIAAQERFLRTVIKRMGFDFNKGRVDRSVHPFTAGTKHDVRITNRYREDNLAPAIFGMIHEAGHALYEQGLDPERYRDPAGGYCSLGVHESQSRLWENLIGRSKPFWSFHLPLLKQAFPTLAPIELDAFLGAINEVRPSLVRVDADEVTYNLHIILRFRLESALLAGDLDVADLPGAWKEQTERLFGLQPATDREGALQDVHWSAGLFGYFPTYALGNLYGAQFLEALRRDVTDLDEQIAAGELSPIKSWLNEKIHRQGRCYLAPELCQRVTGAPLSPTAALSHLERKYGALYQL